MTEPDPGIFTGTAAQSFLGDLRSAPPTSVGDQISAALRTVAQREGELSVDDVEVALVALALLLAESEPAVLVGLADAEEVADWFQDLDVELNPGRRLVARAAIRRIQLADANAWYRQWDQAGRLAEAMRPVRDLQDLLADTD